MMAMTPSQPIFDRFQVVLLLSGELEDVARWIVVKDASKLQCPLVLWF